MANPTSVDRDSFVELFLNYTAQPDNDALWQDIVNAVNDHERRKVEHAETCIDCGADLTLDTAVSAHFSAGGHEFDCLSKVIDVDETGIGGLQDVDHLVERGYHAGSYCGKCGGRVEDL